MNLAQESHPSREVPLLAALYPTSSICVAVLLLLLLAGCANTVQNDQPCVSPSVAKTRHSERPNVPISSIVPGAIELEYRSSHLEEISNSLPSPSATTRGGRLPLSEISLEGTLCLGECPVYTVTLRPDGTASYFGQSYAPRAGKHEGRFSPEAFAYLADLADELGILELDDHYSAAVKDGPTVYLLLVRNGQRKLIKDYMSGPSRLSAFEHEIERIVEIAISWR